MHRYLYFENEGFTLNYEQATALLDVQADVELAIRVAVKNARLTFPPSSGAAPNAKAFSVGDTRMFPVQSQLPRPNHPFFLALTLSASPDVKATGTIAVHLIPSLNVGISALGNKAKADVVLALDTSASLKLSLEASADLQKTISNPTASKKNRRTTSSAAASPKSVSGRAVKTSFGGCFEVGWSPHGSTDLPLTFFRRRSTLALILRPEQTRISLAYSIRTRRSPFSPRTL
jgi:hypothetical protein